MLDGIPFLVKLQQKRIVFEGKGRQKSVFCNTKNYKILKSTSLQGQNAGHLTSLNIGTSYFSSFTEVNFNQLPLLILQEEVEKFKSDLLVN